MQTGLKYHNNILLNFEQKTLEGMPYFPELLSGCTYFSETVTLDITLEYVESRDQ